ncbi:cyclin-dependent kinase 9-like [Microplitis mediator]|uniref:cyclin-dependent kinase 9-like n=1 Tax=Microplitis mediator TaxID=375433 RepID=UPI002552723C|nr:cyclin-dependent kinase 9-like [Microplitis mediator]
MNYLSQNEKYQYIQEYDSCLNTSSNYEKIIKIGQGTYGEVFKARNRQSNKFVAMKKILMHNLGDNGFPISSLRETKILRLLKHKNIINLIEICRSAATDSNYPSIFYLVFDFCEHDLNGLLSNKAVKFSLAEIKMIIKQLLSGLYYIHVNKILHRDIKPSNILITKDGILKIADFGLARPFSDKNPGNLGKEQVVTLWYRAPELLLGDENYGPPIDLWAAGCIMIEMWKRTPIMRGHSEQHQLFLISNLCGSITPFIWQDVEKLELFSKMQLPQRKKRKVKEELKPHIENAYALDLIDNILVIDPKKRFDADTALNHDFFWTDPMPCDLSNKLSQHNHSMFEYFTSSQRLQKKPSEPAIPSFNDNGYQDRIF